MIKLSHILSFLDHWLLKKTCLLVVLIMSNMLVFGQYEEGKGRFSTIPDTAGINRVISKAYTVRETYSDSAAALYKQALSASYNISYRRGIALSLAGIGRYFNIKNDKERSIYFLRQALPFCENNVEGQEMTVSLYTSMSENYYYMGKYDSCALYRYEALNQLETFHIQNPMMQLKVYGKLLQFWLNAHEDIRNDPYIKELAGKFDVLEKTAIANNDSNLLVNVYFQKAGYYSNTGKYDSARYYCKLNLALGRALNVIPSMLMSTLLNIGTTYLEEKKPELAIPYFNEAISIAPEQDKVKNRYLIFADIFLGEAYAMQQHYEQAIAITLPALQKADELTIISLTDRAHKTLADAYEITGDFRAAASHRKQYAAIKDSLMKADKLELVYNVQMKYRIVEKNKELAEKELAIAQNESKLKTKNTWIGGISGGLLLLSVISVLLYRNNKHRQKLQAEKINVLQQDMEIGRLKAVITGEEKERSRIARELHDGIGGTLGSIRGQLSMVFRKHKSSDVTNEFLEIMQLLEDASNELRKTAHNLMPEILLQEGLTKATALFCERVNKGKVVNIHFQTWGEIRTLPSDLELNTYRIIQELVHNILKHAEATEASVQFVFHETQVCITVEDNGKGFSEAAAHQSDGVGIKNIRERVHSLQGQLDIDSQPGKGTSVYIEFNIPANQNTPEICL